MSDNTNINRTQKARAHTNIALIKYWGKADEQLIIPEDNSLSLTLKDFYTDTEVRFDKDLTADEIVFNNHLMNKAESQKMINFLNIVRQKAQQNIFAHVKTQNNIPTAAGLASSASGFAALAAASSKAIGLDLSRKDLSRLARRGSGSATRSIFGGFVEWEKGNNDQTSFAKPIEENVDWDVNLVAVITNRHEKKISSRKGMKISKATSPYYQAFKQVTSCDLITMKKAISNHDFDLMGHTAEENAMKMHALTFSSDPSFTYFNGDTLKAIQLVHELRNEGINCYFTIDAGPNVKVLVQHNNLKKVIRKFKTAFGQSNVVATIPGPGIEYLN
ncbi:diphosphomevalonate decarboxylase [Fructilactobacillus fructivorans]|uniref:diphosphomevalonate decarboxylase n=1 Tax=Fructilactobacillus fructivorans TaxID=1614 RepID=UPI0007055ED8|nr:diphosphomevalonate decarboxylase [Fructilactobacillus fructivorans]KRN13531.1 diphosphomevalonate decarboxylase [Fructilactobacillus fructivorans]